MCDLNGPFKLCTCSDKIDKEKPHWILKFVCSSTALIPKRNKTIPEIKIKCFKSFFIHLG